MLLLGVVGLDGDAFMGVTIEGEGVVFACVVTRAVEALNAVALVAGPKAGETTPDTN